ncbi:redox-regulated ATPase YchF [Candidatus Peregrinibacteria bacterium]|nr:redox-regulated ATPase YchF [Candidatus Peregrinibacteria bacterium]
MIMKIGIVGLPNVGKSTLFNALTKSASAMAANYPFCTIDPNVGIVEVPDQRMKKLAEIVKPEKVVPAVVEFVDIAGLVKGASEGEGLGNQFLSHIRECDAIGQVLRLFKDDNVIHVHGGVDARRDLEIIETELILADLQTVSKRLGKAKNDAKSGDKKKTAYANLVEKIEAGLQAGKKTIDMGLNAEELAEINDLHLLTAKPFLYILNVAENDLRTVIPEQIKKDLGLPESAKVIPISAKVEEELINFTEEESQGLLEELGIKESGLNALIHAAYDTLGLMTYFTAGVKEVRAWTIHKGDTAPNAAGVIHTDFEKNFIRAEVVSFDDFVANGGEQGAKEKGQLRLEGKDYLVKDGDIMHFRHSA